MSTSVDLPPARAPMIGPDGLPTTTYYRFFSFLWRRTGGHIDGIDAIATDIAAIEGDVANLENSVTDLEASDVTMQAEIDAVEVVTEDLFVDIAMNRLSSRISALEARMKSLETEQDIRA